MSSKKSQGLEVVESALGRGLDVVKCLRFAARDVGRDLVTGHAADGARALTVARNSGESQRESEQSKTVATASNEVSIIVSDMSPHLAEHRFIAVPKISALKRLLYRNLNSVTYRCRYFSGKARRMPDPARSSLLNKIEWLLANAKHGNPNERRFLPSAANFLHRGITLSRKQYAWLNSIYYRERYGLSRTYWWWWLRALLTGRPS